MVHSEVADGAEETRFLQAWVRPDEPGSSPDYLSGDVEIGAELDDGRGSRAGRTHRLRRYGAARRRPPGGERLELPDAPRLHVFVARGAAMLGERLLEPTATRPGCATRAAATVTAETDSHLVVWSFRGQSVRG